MIENPSIDELQTTNGKLLRAVRKKETEIKKLREELSQVIVGAQKQTEELRRVKRDLEKRKKRRRHPLNPNMSEIDPGNMGIRQRQMARQGSIATANVLDSLPAFRADTLAEKFLAMFKDPVSNVSYLSSREFADDCVKLCAKVKDIFEEEDRCLSLESPVYVFGDTHGNLEDLHFFADNIWKLGMRLCAGQILFLGDYVDRGMSSLEVVTYLIALKVLNPSKVFMLRGNHETRDVNGWEEHYGERSFLYQCKERFGEDTGFNVWDELNQVFDRLPLAAVIDDEIFCIHGGIPRPLPNSPAGASRIDMLQRVPKVLGINPPYDDEDENLRQMASECIWSDPAQEDQETSGALNAAGYGDSPRGGGTICFGNQALTDFLAEHDLSYIIRAHEAHAYGVSLSKGARCFTVFSTSKDHNQGKSAVCGCILVDFEKIEVITRSPHYRNKYVHRRDSMSVAFLPQAEMEDRERVGLIIEEESSDSEEYYEEEEYDEDGPEEDEGAQHEDHRFNLLDDDDAGEDSNQMMS